MGKLDDMFIEKYLKHDGETISEAKERILREQEKAKEDRKREIENRKNRRK